MKTKKPAFIANFFEKKAWKKNKVVCGIDEVGRGCLCGPVVCAAVIIPSQTRTCLLKDSKVLSASAREKAFLWIQKHCLYAVCAADWKEIDACNIYRTTQKTMHKAYISLIEKYGLDPALLDSVLVDAMPLTLAPSYANAHTEVHSFPHGEQLSLSIAAASIVAKVTRDALMEPMSKLFPAYQCHEHKGYATLLHRKAVNLYGPSLIHRLSYLNSGTKKRSDTARQLNLLE